MPRVLNGFNLFCETKRKVLSTRNPGTSTKDMNSILANMWKDTSKAQKMAYKMKGKQIRTQNIHIIAKL